jgi:flagellar biosynthetic protein FlhB
MDMEIGIATAYIGNLVVDMGLTVGMVFILIAVLDYAYTRYKHNKELKMTKKEVKDEWKQTEGDPMVKSKIKQKMREVSMRRMMQAVPKADVIITNPTHYAVALSYDLQRAGAPIVVAKGVDFLAKRIRELAINNNIQIVENPALARTLYSEVGINEEIPAELYEAVAEILAYVFKLKNKIPENMPFPARA